MPATNPKIEVVVLVDTSTGKTDIRFESEICSSDQCGELWMEVGGSNFVVYQTDDFYDQTLRARRNDDNMISPVVPQRRLSLLGQVWGTDANAPSGYREISRGEFAPKAGGAGASPPNRSLERTREG